MNQPPNNPQKPSDEPPGYGTLPRRIAYIVFVAALFAYTQRHDYAAPSDALLAFTTPLVALSLGVVAGFRLFRIVGTTFRSTGWALVAIFVIFPIEAGCATLLEGAGLRKMLVETLHVSLMFFMVATVIPLVNGQRKQPTSLYL